jgi:hypothetical protein
MSRWHIAVTLSNVQIIRFVLANLFLLLQRIIAYWGRSRYISSVTASVTSLKGKELRRIIYKTDENLFLEVV